MTYTTTVTLKNGDEVDVEVGYNYTPGCPGKMYYANGDPGYPEEPAEVEIVSIKEAETGREIQDEELAEGELERLNEGCFEYAEDSAAEAKAEAAIARWEDRRLFGDDY